MKLGFSIAYLMLVWALMCAGTIYVSVVAFHGAKHAVIKRITNHTPPNELEHHFGKPLATFPQSAIGLPDDGTCMDFSNHVSWRVLVCFGTQPEAQP